MNDFNKIAYEFFELEKQKAQTYKTFTFHLSPAIKKAS